MSQDPSNVTPPTDAGPSAGGDTSDEKSSLADSFYALPRSLKLVTALIIIVVLAVIFAIWRDFYFHWFEVHTGTNNETGLYYAFWSGFGSDVGEATIIVGIVAAWRHHNCHVKGCPRLGRPVPGTPYVACPRHHPSHEGTKRGISLETLIKAHEAAKKQNNLS
ncbi:MAG TPA: hypothetical protein VIJ40_10655 [Acidimicrobiales bacterium]